MTNEAPPAPPLLAEAERARGAAAPVRTAQTRPDLRDGSEQREAIRTRTRQRPGTIDKFHVPEHKIPSGMSYEWKRHSVMGAPDPSYDQAMAENGWEPVDTKRHPEFMPAGHKGPIIRDGLMLMERPIELTEEARAEDRQIARDQVRVKEEQLGQTAPGQFSREHASARAVTRVGKSYEPMPIPGD